MRIGVIAFLGNRFQVSAFKFQVSGEGFKGSWSFVIMKKYRIETVDSGEGM